jgi:hypothetical protein
VPRPKTPFKNPKAWTRTEISPVDWEVPLGDAALKELDAVIKSLRLQNLPVYMLNPAQFELSATQARMQEARRRAYDGLGFAVVDRLPLDDWSVEEAHTAMWLILSQVSQPVAQSANGQIFRDIKETADRGLYNQGLTQERLTFHTDNSGNRNLPNFSTLMCLYKAEEGGTSEYCTMYSLYNAMMKDAPEQLDRLFQPFLHNRQDIQIPGEPEVIWAPAIGYDGERLLSRFSLNKITTGYKRVGQELDNLGRDSPARPFGEVHPGTWPGADLQQPRGPAPSRVVQERRHGGQAAPSGPHVAA